MQGFGRHTTEKDRGNPARPIGTKGKPHGPRTIAIETMSWLHGIRTIAISTASPYRFVPTTHREFEENSYDNLTNVNIYTVYKPVLSAASIKR